MDCNNEEKIVFMPMFIVVIILTVFVSVAANETPPLAPDMAQYALNLMTIQCQNLNDFAAQTASGNMADYEATKVQFRAAVSNFDYLISSFVPEIVDQFNQLLRKLDTCADCAQSVAEKCNELRSLTYQEMLSYNGIFNPPASINSFDECINAGFFLSGNTCFTGGNLVFDKNGYLVGLYNANCFENSNFYQGTCWYCRYGNNENGCNDYPLF